jgi:FkbM family methyltransferase
MGAVRPSGIWSSDLAIKYDARIRQLARAAWHHPVTESLWQSAAGQFLRRAVGLPIIERVGEVTRIEGILVSTGKYGCNLRFFVGNRRDLLQSHHFIGEFYEAEELKLIQRHFKANGTFVDIGANVGNHTIFASKILNATKVIPFELHPDALAILTANIALNDCQNVDTSFLGYGVSSSAERLSLQRASYGNNLAGARFKPEANGSAQSFPTISADIALNNTWVDFIKIDIEGMEMDALKSLEQTIQRCRPTIFVEVDNYNRDKFMTWCRSHKYTIVETTKRYEWNVNYLLVDS